MDGSGSNDGALDGETAGNKAHLGDLEVAIVDGEREDGGGRSQDGEEEVPVGVGGGGDDELVDLAADLDLILALHGNELLGSELHGLVLLALGTGEDDDVAAHLGGELDGKVAETTDTDDTDTVGRLDVVCVEGVEDGGTTAHQRS